MASRAWAPSSSVAVMRVPIKRTRKGARIKLGEGGFIEFEGHHPAQSIVLSFMETVKRSSLSLCKG
jgi:hypothetical protein